MPKQCRSCNATLAIEARFCPSCGARLSLPGEGASIEGARLPSRTDIDPGVRDPFEAETLDRNAPNQDELQTPAQLPAMVPQPRRTALESGQEFGPYRLIRPIGKGGFGQVWEADSLKTGRRIALKVLMTAPAATKEQIERFKREGRLAASLSHANCVYVFGAEEIEGRPTISMELMPGGTLQDRLREDGPLPYRKAVDYTLQIIDGLEAAAAAGMIHRDIKPSNCFLDMSGSVRIGDFGLSKTLDMDSDLTATGSFLGTPAFSSPEQIKGRDVDSLSDQYSVGATLYALLVGEPPFAGSDGAQVLARILSEPPRPFSDHRLQIPRGLRQVVMRLLAKDKSRRYPSYAALRSALLPYSTHGLAAGGRGARFIAVSIDFAAIQAALGFISGFAYFLNPATLVYQLMEWALTLVYFANQEWLWGRTVGKRLLSLRVEAIGGGPPAFGQVALRVGFFSIVLYAPIIALIAAYPGISSQELSENLSFWILGMALPYALLLSTMRRRNGFAALHDLASRTRVRLTAPARSSIPDISSGLTAQFEPSVQSFTPYQNARIVWTTESESLLLAHDPELRRDVWIHSFQDDARAPAPSSLRQDRPGRLRWLQGSRKAGNNWDVYEAPSGIGLAEWIRARRRLPWANLSELLLDLAEELEARQAHTTAAPPLSIRHVWVDGHGQARLMDFPSHLQPGERAEGRPSQDWRAFLHQVLLFGCEGRLLEPEHLDQRIPMVPLPEYLRPLVNRMCGRSQPLESPAEVIRELRSLAGKTPKINRLRRLGPLVVTAAPAFFLLSSLALETVRLLRTWRRCSAAIESLDAMGERSDQETKRRALRLLQAHTYAELKDVATRALNPVSTLAATERLESIRAEERAAMEALLREHSPTAGELAEARRQLEAIEPGASPWSRTLRWLLLGIVPLAIPALILAPIVRGAPLLALFGMSLQTHDGRRAGRLRSLLRAMVVWAPFVLFRLWQPWAVFHIVFPLALVIGISYTLARPERGIPDLIVGTHLVPR
jgi:uncharacterized RDD family membrane protein YckC